MALRNLSVISGSSQGIGDFSLQTQLVLQPAADTFEKYKRPSSDLPQTTCMQSPFPDANDSHMSEGPDGAHIGREQGHSIL